MCAGTMHIGGFFYYNSWESVKALQTAVLLWWTGFLSCRPLYVKRKLTFLRALCELDNLVVRSSYSVFEWSHECRELSSAFNCVTDLLSVVELEKSVFSTSWFMEILNLYF